MGLIVSWLYKEFIGPMIIIAIGDNTINKNNRNWICEGNMKNEGRAKKYQKKL